MLQGARGRKGPRLLARALQAPSLALRGCANPDPIPGKAVGTETRPLCCSLPAEARWGFSLPTAAGWSGAVCRKHLLEGTKSWAGTCSGSTHTSLRGCSSNAPHPRGGFKSSAPSPPRPRALVLSEWLLPSFSSSERGCQPPGCWGGGVLGCSIPFQHGEVRRDGEGAGFVRCGVAGLSWLRFLFWAGEGGAGLVSAGRVSALAAPWTAWRCGIRGRRLLPPCLAWPTGCFAQHQAQSNPRARSEEGK